MLVNFFFVGVILWGCAFDQFFEFLVRERTRRSETEMGGGGGWRQHRSNN